MKGFLQKAKAEVKNFSQRDSRPGPGPEITITSLMIHQVTVRLPKTMAK
jgi:hypothetical protein